MKFLSIEKVMKKAGGAAKLQETLVRAGQPYPSHPRMCNWVRRNSIPASWTGAIIWALACKGVNPLHLLDDTARR